VADRLLELVKAWEEARSFSGTHATSRL